MSWEPNLGKPSLGGWVLAGSGGAGGGVVKQLPPS